MDKQEYLQVSAALVGIAAYVILVVGIIKTNKEQNFAAFLLWGMLDSVATITSIIGHGNFWLPLSNAFGASVIAVLLMVKKQVSWSRMETLTSVLVVLCLIIWFSAGERAGIIASSLATVIASIPQMVDTYNKPTATPLGAYLVFLIANFIALFAGTNWTIEERFYAACSVFLTLVIVFLALRKRINN